MTPIVECLTALMVIAVPAVYRMRFREQVAMSPMRILMIAEHQAEAVHFKDTMDFHCFADGDSFNVKLPAHLNLVVSAIFVRKARLALRWPD